MAAKSPQALERKRARARQYWHTHARYRHRVLPDHVEAESGDWLVVTCQNCFQLFDVRKNKAGRIRSLCDECNK